MFTQILRHWYMQYLPLIIIPHVIMEKICRYRTAQKQTFEEFFNKITDSGICEYCDSYEECMEIMGADNIDMISGNGCSAFDSSVDKIKKRFLVEQCTKIGT